MSRRFEETRPENKADYSSSQINAFGVDTHCRDYGEFDERGPGDSQSKHISKKLSVGSLLLQRDWSSKVRRLRRLMNSEFSFFLAMN